MTAVDRVWHRCRLATLSTQRPGLGVVEDGLVAATEGMIVYAGPKADAPVGLDAAQRIDCEGRWITPGLIDCHTHLVYGGDRAERVRAAACGRELREDRPARRRYRIDGEGDASAPAKDELVSGAQRRLDALIGEGVTTVEIKSGYGLELETERRQLQRRTAPRREHPITVRSTFLGAHALPPERRPRSGRYIAEVCEHDADARRRGPCRCRRRVLREASPSRRKRRRECFRARATLDLPVKLHADQLSNLGGAALAARFGALSADHLEYADEDGVAAMARAGTVAVVLPGAFYFLRERQAPPIEVMRRHRVPIALATDCNPGTSPLTSLLLAMNMAATLFRLTVDECLAGVTREAARALGLFNEIGSLEAGKRCDLAIWDIERPAELVYRIGFNPLHARVWRGQTT